MNMNVFVPEYNKALKLIEDLKGENIEACITQGGISIYPTKPKDFGLIQKACEVYGAEPSFGSTPIEKNISERKIWKK